jgi:LCP family protein required for cell wall assembly
MHRHLTQQSQLASHEDLSPLRELPEPALTSIEGRDGYRPDETYRPQDPYGIRGLFDDEGPAGRDGAPYPDRSSAFGERPGSYVPGGPEEPGPKKTRKRRRRNILIAIGVFVVLLVGTGTGLFFERQSSYNNNITRIPGAFPTEANRPAAGPKGAENWLLIGSDTRVEGERPGQTSFGGQRSDTIMLVHLPRDRNGAYLMSIPRDSWVSIPGHGKSKINAAFSWGGSPLLIRTVEGLTGVRVDHFAILNFEGMKAVTDALGGVDVRVAETVTDPMHNQTWKAGINHLDGERALWFVRQRHGLPGGDFDRIKRQQAFLKALASKAVSRGTFTNPLKLNAFLGAMTKSVSVDDTVSIGKLRSLAFGFRNIRASDIAFMTSPSRGTGRQGAQSVVFLDPVKCRALFQAMRQDKVAEYLQTRGGANRVDTVE